MNANKLTLFATIVASGLFVSPAFAITGGVVDEANTYSNVGAVVFLPPGYDAPFVASGTLIAPRVLLTAGHVTADLDRYPRLHEFAHVSFGADAFDANTWLEIETWVTHPDYRDFGAQNAGNNPQANDVGVIILKEPVADVAPAQLPHAGFLDDLKAAHLLREAGQGGTPLIDVGYGSTLHWPPPESVPEDGLRRFVETEYLGLTKSWLLTLQNLATGNGGGGFGDSGGPNFWVAPDGSLVLVAITSRGDPNLVATNVTWRVDLPETLDFIDSVLQMMD